MEKYLIKNNNISYQNLAYPQVTVDECGLEETEILVNNQYRLTITGHVEELVERAGIGIKYIDGPSDYIYMHEVFSEGEILWTFFKESGVFIYQDGFKDFCESVYNTDAVSYLKFPLEGEYTFQCMAGIRGPLQGEPEIQDTVDQIVNVKVGHLSIEECDITSNIICDFKNWRY
jgi:hypothetical protein